MKNEAEAEVKMKTMENSKDGRLCVTLCMLGCWGGLNLIIKAQAKPLPPRSVNVSLVHCPLFSFVQQTEK